MFGTSFFSLFIHLLLSFSPSSQTPTVLLEAVRGLWLADPELGPKPLLAKLREQQPDLGAGSKEVRKALTALKAESEAAKETREQNNNTDPVGGSAGAG